MSLLQRQTSQLRDSEPATKAVSFDLFIEPVGIQESCSCHVKDGVYGVAMLHHGGVALVLHHGGVLESAAAPRIWVL